MEIVFWQRNYSNENFNIPIRKNLHWCMDRAATPKNTSSRFEVTGIYPLDPNWNSRWDVCTQSPADNSTTSAWRWSPIWRHYFLQDSDKSGNSVLVIVSFLHTIKNTWDPLKEVSNSQKKSPESETSSARARPSQELLRGPSLSYYLIRSHPPLPMLSIRMGFLFVFQKFLIVNFYFI